MAVLEYRAGVSEGPAAAQRLAERLKKTAALEIIDPSEARRRFARVDADVAKCSGEAECTARLGNDLDVDEVLLVALSQLGDLVLAMQRIDVDSSQIKAQLSEVVPAGGNITDAQLDDWLRQLFPPETFKRYGFLSVKADVDGARVTINGKPHGETPLANKIRLLAPKNYQVDVVKKGRVPFSARIDVAPDSTFEVNAQLPSEGERVSWYKRWYVWAVVGGVVAAGAAGTVVYLNKPDDLHSRGTVYFPSP